MGSIPIHPRQFRIQSLALGGLPGARSQPADAIFDANRHRPLPAHRVDGYGKACLPSEPRMLEGDRDARALVARLEELDRRLNAAEAYARGALSPRVLEKAQRCHPGRAGGRRRRLGRLTALAMC